MDWEPTKVHNISITWLLIILIGLIFTSAFFSGSEIGMMSVNRYRLKHLARKNNKRAQRVLKMLEAPDRLLGIILIGNTLANIIASAVATVIGQRLYGDPGMAIATGLLTLFILIFAEMTPKTLAAIYPEKVAFAVSMLLRILSIGLFPLITLSSALSNGLLRLFGVNTSYQSEESLTGEELRTVVKESGSFSSSRYKSMFLALLDLESVTVEDIMIPKGEIIGIDLTESWTSLLYRLETAQHTRLPVYEGDIEHVKGMIHIRNILNLMAEEKLSIDNIHEVIEKPYFVLEDTGLYQQLIQFQQEKRRSGFVVDEYGNMKGLVTLEDILEEIVGEFTTDVASLSKNVIQEDDQTFLIDATISIRELNKILSWALPLHGPKTLNGLITELLGFIPPAKCCLKLNSYPCEILQVKDNMIKTVRITLKPISGR